MRKVYYNLAITGLSVAICFFIGTIEVLGLLPTELHLHGRFWNDMADFNINTAGFIIVGMFVVTWVGALTHLEVRPRRGEVVGEAHRPDPRRLVRGCPHRPGPRVVASRIPQIRASHHRI